MKAKTVDALRLRPYPLLSAGVIRVMPANEALDVTMDCAAISGGLEWWIVIDSLGNKGWAAAKWIAWTDTQPPPPPPPATNYLKIGLHLHVANNIAACLQVYSDCAQAGKPVPIAVVINNPGLVNAIKRVSPKTFVVCRYGVGGTALDELDLTENDTAANMAAGKARFEQRFATCDADCWQIANESYDKGHPDWKIKAMAEFYIGAMFAAEAKGVKITVFDGSTGTPEDSDLPLLAPMLQKANDDNHFFCYHGYSAPGIFDMTYASEWYSMRFERIIRGYPKLKVVIGECGGYGTNGSNIMGMMRQYQAMLATNPAVIGAAVFTANAAQDWIDAGCSFDPYLNEYSRWMQSL